MTFNDPIVAAKRHAVAVANHGTEPSSVGIGQWLSEINGSAPRDDDIDVRHTVVVRLRTKIQRWALQALGRRTNPLAWPETVEIDG
ncbi:hypothetical protein [Haloplanus pelagicus]|uniref:hypothetical protein n=1 Tax=Haloplanus pelagicus TaxID=2949995 RepID=UPI00203DCAD0|nr:hypothetical protein [Haloplanus sp. HW8-1]